MLLTLILIPLLGALTVAMMPEDRMTSYFNSVSDYNRSRKMRIALLTTLITFAVSIVMWAEFDSSSSQYQFTIEFNKASFCHLHLGIDGLSLYFVLLTTFTMPIAILSSWKSITKHVGEFLVLLLVLESLLIGVFVVLDLLLFYVFFEAVLIPLFIIVGVWGASAARVRASFLLFLYTLFGSLFMLLAFIFIYYHVGTTDMVMISLADIDFNHQKWLWIAIFLSLAIKTPLVPFHIWLSRAHVEAPIAGSIILAGLILKLATYGFLRVLIPYLPEASVHFSPFVQTIAVITLIYSSLTTIRQTDFKCLVAYSSVAHMSVSTIALFSNTIQGIEGAILLGIAHGFVSPALFICVGAVLYDRFHTRAIRYYRGLTSYMPLFSTMFFMFTLANIGTPTTINWIGETISLIGTFQLNPITGFLMSTGIVLSAGYSIWLYNRLAFGASSLHTEYTPDLSRREYIMLLSLLVPTIFFGLCPNVILTDLHYSVSTLLYTIV